MLYYRGLHLQSATWIADSQLEAIKNAGCAAAATTGAAGTTVQINDLSTVTNPGTLKIVWPTTTTQDPCTAAAPTTKPACSATVPTVAGVCVTWTEPGSAANRTVGLTTYVGPP